MKTVLQIAITTLVARCAITHIERHLRLHLLQSTLSGLTKAKVDQFEPSKEQHEQVNQRLKQEIEDVLKINSELQNRGTPLKSDIILTEISAKIWNDATCIDFVEDPNAIDKLVVLKGDVSYSSIGRDGGDQDLAISKNYITVWSAVHELGHALGFLHTMQRYDRDNYIRIVTQNLDPAYATDFQKMARDCTDVYGLDYDYGSVMHYGELSGTVNDQPTMIALDAHYQSTMGSELISFSDIFTINEHYGCNAKCNKTASAKCENEGFPHPRNCSICICPGGYGGALCDRRPPGCGEDLVAKSRRQTLSYRIGFGSNLREEFSFCNYMIMAPEGKRIEVDVRSISYGYDLPGCIWGGIEVKAQKDQKLTGYRFCSMDGSDGPIISSSNLLPVILFNRYGKMQATFTYRFVD